MKQKLRATLDVKDKEDSKAHSSLERELLALKAEKLKTDREHERALASLREQQKQRAKVAQQAHAVDLESLMESNKILKMKIIKSQEVADAATARAEATKKELAARDQAHREYREKREKDMVEFKQKIRAKVQKANADTRARKELQQSLDESSHKLEWAHRRMLELQREAETHKTGAEEWRRKAELAREEASAVTQRPTAVPESQNKAPSAASNDMTVSPGGSQLAALRWEMEKEELKAKHLAELKALQKKHEDVVQRLEADVSKLRAEAAETKALATDDAPTPNGETKANGHAGEPPSDATTTSPPGSPVRLARADSEFAEELNSADREGLVRQVRHWRGLKVKADTELARMESALASWREQLANSQALSQENLKIRQQLADASKAKLLAQQQALRARAELESTRKTAAADLRTAREARRVATQRIAALQAKARQSSADDERRRTEADFMQKFESQRQTFERSEEALRKEAAAARREAKDLKKRRDFAKREFLKVLDELETARRAVGELKLEREERAKRYRARISDLETLLGVEGDDLSVGTGADRLPRSRSSSASGLDGVALEILDGKSTGAAPGDTRLFDVDLVEVPRTLADVTLEQARERAGRVLGLAAKIVKACAEIKKSAPEVEAQGGSGGVDQGGNDDDDDGLSLFERAADQKRRRKNNKSSAELVRENAEAVREELGSLVQCLVDVARHQTRCQMAIASQAADRSSEMQGGCVAGMHASPNPNPNFDPNPNPNSNL